ncbi:hypothetical protein VOLCADRAFT_95188 [Volvox carteri f. nagariensis]|uniref:Uncharacterized protein n=1 Tax=Volvox carteri f. nagariensis TaxID=3068 RepID=D8U6U8_VOLCA|nr:uncharacterized protein VOLCADRAFT_95188 [Volvox carteri f. nagariensis]EFJ44574.1 hypothetical protein VOLCADRAFT_95188 [Volvox carteri f. nagariensis]|eukprot:XP_002954424.1 hypothetical protein VOLCADRAFT_95188 [Volvox carteri f. nagariensis]
MSQSTSTDSARTDRGDVEVSSSLHAFQPAASRVRVTTSLPMAVARGIDCSGHVASFIDHSGLIRNHITEMRPEASLPVYHLGCTLDITGLWPANPPHRSTLSIIHNYFQTTNTSTVRVAPDAPPADAGHRDLSVLTMEPGGSTFGHVLLVTVTPIRHEDVQELGSMFQVDNARFTTMSTAGLRTDTGTLQVDLSAFVPSLHSTVAAAFTASAAHQRTLVLANANMTTRAYEGCTASRHQYRIWVYTGAMYSSPYSLPYFRAADPQPSWTVLALVVWK